MKVLVIGGFGEDRKGLLRLAAAIATVAAFSPPEDPVVVEMPVQAAFTNLKVCQPYYDEFENECLDGIFELRDWLVNQVACVLNRLHWGSGPGRIIFQPCWSRRRWKSLT